MSRLGLDGDESIYFDREKPVVGEVDGFKGQLFEECDPVDLCEELEAKIAALEVYKELLAWVDLIVPGDSHPPKMHRTNRYDSRVPNPAGWLVNDHYGETFTEALIAAREATEGGGDD